MPRVLGKSSTFLQVLLVEEAFVIMQLLLGQERGRAFVGTVMALGVVDLTHFFQ